MIISGSDFEKEGIMVEARKNDKAIGYVRVSTNEQAANGLSPHDQEERIKSYCAAEGLDLVTILIDDGVSGSIPLRKRPGGGSAVSMLETAGVGSVVALKLDRLFRSTKDCLDWTEKWEKDDVALHLLDFGGTTLKTDTAMGKFFITVMAAIGELERGLAGERITNIMERKAIDGEWHGGPVPLGYKYDTDGSVVENDPQAFVVRSIFDMRANGKGINDILEWLMTHKKRTSKGKHFTDISIRRILRNRTYIGERVYEGTVYPLDVPVLIDRATWDKVNAPASP